MHVRRSACTYVWVYVGMHACMHAWMDGRMDGWMHGRMCVCNVMRMWDTGAHLPQVRGHQQGASEAVLSLHMETMITKAVPILPINVCSDAQLGAQR